MPIFEYRCLDCGKRYEELVLKKEDEPKQCRCGGHLEKLISNTSFILKGEGWYKDGYSKKEK